MEPSKFTIVGGGLAGSLMAIMLGRHGYEVDLFEKRPDLREEVVDGGRSINLALSHRGLLPLEKIGLREKVQELLIPMKGRMIHTDDGKLSFQPYGKDDTEVINSISRLDLNKLLLDQAESHDNITLYFNHTCLEYDNRSNTLLIENAAGGSLEIHPEAIIAADGVNSAVRTSMLKMGRFNYSQTYMDYGYKELEIPASPNSDFQLEPNALHIWPRKRFVMIALPNPDKSFTLTLFAPFKGENSFENLREDPEIKQFFNSHFPDAVDLMPTLVEDMKSNPTGNLVTVRCEPWNKGNAVLIGDAAHAIIPFYGQGMNAAFEDVRILEELVQTHENWNEIIRTFSTIRKPNGDAIANLSYDNFIEMRDGVADEEFRDRKKIELQMYEQFDDIISKYAMVTFHPELEYQEAKIKGDILEQTIEDYFNEHGSISDQDLEQIHQLVLQKYKSVAVD